MNWVESLGWTNKQINDLRYIAYLYLSEGKYDLATSFFKALTVFDPNNVFDMQSLGALYLETGKSIEALSYLNLSLKIEPNNSVTLLNKTKALFNVGHKNQALNLARALQGSTNKIVKDQAEALVIAYS